MRTITTEQINEILAKQNRGENITRTENFIYQGMPGTLNSNFAFVYNNEELLELLTCAKDPIYFIEKHCKIAGEDGTLDNIKLYGFQKEWIKNYEEKRFLVQSISRQTNYMIITACYYLWCLVFSYDKSLLFIPSKKSNGIDFLGKIGAMYRNLPYFLKPAVIEFTNTHISFLNGMSARVGMNDYSANYDIIHYIDFESKNADMLAITMAIQAARKGSKLVVHSNPGTGGDSFKKIVLNAERKDGDPQKNVFHLIKTYWWEVPNRDMNWREDIIKENGEDFFNGYFDNLF